MLIMVIFSRLWPRMTGIQSKLEQLGSTIPSFKAYWIYNRNAEARELHNPEYENVNQLRLNMD